MVKAGFWLQSALLHAPTPPDAELLPAQDAMHFSVLFQPELTSTKICSECYSMSELRSQLCFIRLFTYLF